LTKNRRLAALLVGNTVANENIYFTAVEDKCEFGLMWWKSKSKKCSSTCKKAHKKFSQHISLQNPREKEEDAAMVMFALSSRASRPSSQRTRWALAVGQREESQSGWVAARLVRMLCKPPSTIAFRS